MHIEFARLQLLHKTCHGKSRLSVRANTYTPGTDQLVIDGSVTRTALPSIKRFTKQSAGCSCVFRVNQSIEVLNLGLLYISTVCQVVPGRERG